MAEDITNAIKYDVTSVYAVEKLEKETSEGYPIFAYSIAVYVTGGKKKMYPVYLGVIEAKGIGDLTQKVFNMIDLFFKHSEEKFECGDYYSHCLKTINILDNKYNPNINNR
jgi:hypothetical protein